MARRGGVHGDGILVSEEVELGVIRDRVADIVVIRFPLGVRLLMERLAGLDVVSGDQIEHSVLAILEVHLKRVEELEVVLFAVCALVARGELGRAGLWFGGLFLGSLERHGRPASKRGDVDASQARRSLATETALHGGIPLLA